MTSIMYPKWGDTSLQKWYFLNIALQTKETLSVLMIWSTEQL